MHKTITELSRELSISRQAIHQVIDKLLDKKSIQKKGNAFILNTKEQGIIVDYFRDDSKVYSSSKSSKTSSDLTSVLQQQNEFLMKELENKNKQIEELHILLLKEKDSNRLVEAKEVPKYENHEYENHEIKKNEKKIKTDKIKKKKWYEIFKINND